MAKHSTELAAAGIGLKIIKHTLCLSPHVLLPLFVDAGDTVASVVCTSRM
jgi:hypothetical protein